MLGRRRPGPNLPLLPRRRPRRWDRRILLQIDVPQSETDGMECFKFQITLAGRTNREGYLDCGGIRLRALHKLSTEASRDGAVDMLVRLPATKNELVLRRRTGKETVRNKTALGFVRTLRSRGRRRSCRCRPGGLAGSWRQLGRPRRPSAFPEREHHLTIAQETRDEKFFLLESGSRTETRT